MAGDRLVTRFIQSELNCTAAEASTSVSAATRAASSEAASTSAPAPAIPAARRAPAALDPAALAATVGSEGPLRDAALLALGAVSRVFMHGLNRTVVHGQEHLEAALRRDPSQGLVTVANHSAALDDPLVTAAMLPLSTLSQPRHLRWTLCASDRCFTNPVASAFFRTVKVLPVERGAGLVQPGMAAAEQLLRQGQWVHIFPEGTRRRSDDLSQAQTKPGVGRLIAAAAGVSLQEPSLAVPLPVSGGTPSVASAPPSVPPLVLPFVHVGMDLVQPRGQPIPGAGKTVHVLVGPPIDVRDLLTQHGEQALTDRELYTAIADRVGSTLHGMRARLLHSLSGDVLDLTESGSEHLERSLGADAAATTARPGPSAWGRRLELQFPSQRAVASFRVPEVLVATALAAPLWTQSKWTGLGRTGVTPAQAVLQGGLLSEHADGHAAAEPARARAWRAFASAGRDRVLRGFEFGRMFAGGAV